MAAPKGNKNAVGFGRPPNPGYTDQDLVKLGEELLKWMKECDADKKCDVVHLSEFYSEKKGIPRSQWDSIVRRDCFVVYYEKAREWMGKKIMKNKYLPTAYGSRFLGIYFRELDEHEFEKEKRKIDYELQRKTELDSKPPPLTEKINLENENMRLKAELLKYNADNKSKTR